MSSDQRPSAMHLLHRASQEADEIFAGAATGPITPRQYAVLDAVARCNKPNQTTLVHMTGIDRSTLADIARRLVEKGYLARKRGNGGDERSYAVRLTEQGEEVLRVAGPAVKNADDRLLAVLNERERDAFVAALKKVVEGAESNRANKAA